MLHYHKSQFATLKTAKLLIKFAVVENIA